MRKVLAVNSVHIIVCINNAHTEVCRNSTDFDLPCLKHMQADVAKLVRNAQLKFGSFYPIVKTGTFFSIYVFIQKNFTVLLSKDLR